MRTMSILSGKPVPTDPVAALPWEVGNPRNLPQVMTNIGFQNAICTAYEHPLHVELPDMVKLVAGPDGQFAPMLDRMKAGRDNIYQEAAQVQMHPLSLLQTLKRDTMSAYGPHELVPGTSLIAAFMQSYKSTAGGLLSVASGICFICQS